MFTKGRYFRKSFEPKGLSIAPKTLANFLERKTQLYEQGATVRRIGQYVRNWWRWVRAGVVISVMNNFTVSRRVSSFGHSGMDFSGHCR